jgi:hypothetical protein
MPMTRSSRATLPLSGGRYTGRMMAGRWWRLAWAIAVFALAGTPAVRAFCAATCDTSAAHAGHAAPAASEVQAGGHEHGHHHGAAVAEGRAADARITPATLPCDDLTAAVAAPRAGVVTTPPAAVFDAGALPRADGRHVPAASPAPPRPPGGAEAQLPLRI